MLIIYINISAIIYQLNIYNYTYTINYLNKNILFLTYPTKYFSFATLDGQFEYTRLPFGYSEAPAKFQKRIIQILNPLIRQDKIIVYIDDILIPSESVDKNFKVLKETLTLLKRFEVNYSKCLFAKKKIEFLGYVISYNEATLSPRHTEAIDKFKQPTNVHEVQRFLGLASYFRRFIKDFSTKAKPLQNLLRKDVKFCFDKECKQSFDLLKKELVSSPILALYNPSAENELHTDACSRCPFSKASNWQMGSSCLL